MVPAGSRPATRRNESPERRPLERRMRVGLVVIPAARHRDGAAYPAEAPGIAVGGTVAAREAW